MMTSKATPNNAANQVAASAPKSTRSLAASGASLAQVSSLTQLQRNLGNQAMQQLLESGAIQAKLRISQPGDADEREADRIAMHIVRSQQTPALQRKCSCSGGASCAKCEDEELKGIHRKASRFSTASPAGIDSPAKDLGSGHQMDPLTRQFMESRFGHDFSEVRIHEDARAAQSTRSVDARAYTFEKNVVFNNGEYSPHTETGKQLLAHELTHVVQQNSASPISQFSSALAPAVLARSETKLHRAPAANSFNAAVCETTNSPPDVVPGQCSYKWPENCPSYEEWLLNFNRLKSFKGRASPVPSNQPPNVFDILGGGAADRYESKPSGKGAPPPPTTPLRAGEKFIDHPTDDWVKNCLPENLRATAYQLPSDCADIAVILRHVWLSAHRRTEKFGKWTIGDQAGGAAADRVLGVIGEVFTGNVAAVVNPYSDASGAPLRTFAQLEPLLHPGDILVWEHHEKGIDNGRTGGHTHTITSVQRDDSGKILSIGTVYGNQPIFEEEKVEILDKLKSQKAPLPTKKELGDAPGRRIETDTLSGNALKDVVYPPTKKGAPSRTFWTWEKADSTTIVVAGPPKAAPRPAKQKGSAKRKLSDWVASFSPATSATIIGVFEAMLLEARALLEGGQDITEEEARRVGSSAGQRVWELARGAADLADQSHFQMMEKLHALLHSIQTSRLFFTPQGNSPQDDITTKLLTTLGWIDEAFSFAARGATDTDFSKNVPAKIEAVNVLVTGFDPFDPSGSLAPPQPGEWNPSGAAALALDNARIPIEIDKGKKAVAAVESVVLPVSFTDFQKGIVEKIAKPLLDQKKLDAALTVSLDPSLSPTDPVRFERYAVGVHFKDKLEAVPAAPGGKIGPALIESTAPVKQIAADTAAPGKGKTPGIAQPSIGEGVVFQFSDIPSARAAAEALQLPTPSANSVTISKESALQQIIQTMARDPDGIHIVFRAGKGQFKALVSSGPGGSFLSNEVSFRMLRLIQESKLSVTPASFHIHTPGGGAIPQDPSTPKAQKDEDAAVAQAKGIRARLIETLRATIVAVARWFLKGRGHTLP